MGRGENWSYNKTQDLCNVMFGEFKLCEADCTVVWETSGILYIGCTIYFLKGKDLNCMCHINAMNTKKTLFKVGQCKQTTLALT